MPALEVSRSMLVNQGLSALAPGADIASAAELPHADIVGSFTRFVVDNRISAADQDFVGIITASTSPLDLATVFINAKYAELGGVSGLLGTTMSAVIVALNSAGFVRKFQHGAIYWHPNVGAHEVHGPIRARWQELGGEKGFLGFPTSDVTPGADARSVGFFAHFQGGSVYWAPVPLRVATIGATLSGSVSTASPASATTAVTAARLATGAPSQMLTRSNLPGNQSMLLHSDQLHSAIVEPSPAVASNLVFSGVRGGFDFGLGTSLDFAESSAGAYEVHGTIRQKYLALGAEASILGYPQTDETGTPDGIGRFNHFQGGSIYWTPATSAHEVHGLIRDRWASLGWERNPQLGYPITDEFIPDRRIGHRRPEARKKPILSMPGDVLKLPAEAATAGFARTVVNAPIAAASAPTNAPAVMTRTFTATPRESGFSGALGNLSASSALLAATSVASGVAQPAFVTALDPGVFSAIATMTMPASTPADQRSVNRFADFENGVLFWFRGATSASTLSPHASTADGTSFSFSGADIAAAAMSKIGKSTFEAANVLLLSMTFLGTTGYSFDGAQVHNRRHRLQLILQGVETHTISGPLGISVPQIVPVTATVELQIEVWFDASQRRIILTPTDWTLTQASSGSYSAAVSSAYRAKLDPLLWTGFELLTLPDTDAGAPIAVLSVKTLPNGAVGVFVEPQHNLVQDGIGQLANAVTPSFVVFSQPH